MFCTYMCNACPVDPSQMGQKGGSYQSTGMILAGTLLLQTASSTSWEAPFRDPWQECHGPGSGVSAWLIT